MRARAASSGVVGSQLARLVGAGLLACAVLLGVPLASIGPESAVAGLGNPIPANEIGDPTDEFTDNNALFVYVNSDIRGGQVCVVAGNVTDPSGMDCGSAAWGGKNTVVGIGLQYALVASPPLKPGTWRLLATDQEGEGGKLSPPFTVSPCPTGQCDFTIANQVVSGVKAAAAKNIIGAATTCLTFAAVELKDALVKVRGRTDTLGSTAKDYSSGGGFAALVVGGAGAGLSFVSLPTLSNPGEEKALEILRELTCTLTSMYSDIVADPPDPNYGTVGTAEFSTIPALETTEQDDVARAVDRQRGFGVALLRALERYQGALADSSTTGIASQAAALDENTTELITELRETAAALRAYATQLDSDPHFSGPVLTPEERDALLAIYSRVKADGFSAGELMQLDDLGYSAAEIAAIRTRFEIDATKLPTTETVQQVLRVLATTLETDIPAWDLLARSAAAVAGRAGSSGGNRMPIASDDALSTAPGTAGSVNVLANDSDPDGDPLSLTTFTPGGSGGVTCTTSGQCTYTPSPGFSGSDSFTYTVSDGKGGADLGTVAVTVGSGPQANRPPVAGDDLLATAFGQPGTVAVLTNDSDPDGDTLTVTAITAAGHGNVSCTPGGSCTYSPVAGFSGADTFTYTVSDGKGGTDVATVRVTVNGPSNQSPVAVGDVLSTPANQAGSVNVLANDSDPDGDSLTVSASTQGANGSVGCTPSGTCTYTPNTSFSGSDSFTYTVSDGKGGAAVGTVAVTVSLAPLLVDFTAPAGSINEGSFGTFTPHVSGAVFPVTVRWEAHSAGGTVVTQTGSSPTLLTTSRSLGFPEDGDIQVSLTVTDAAGRTQSATKSVHVVNVAPSPIVAPCLLAPGDTAHALVGVEFGPCSWSMTDLGRDDRPASVLECELSWGDGTPTSTASCPAFAPKHTYAAPGTFRITVAVTDTDGATTTRTADVVVVKQQTFVNVFVTPTEGSGTRVTGRLWQRATARFGWAPRANAPITLHFGDRSETLTTDADGRVEATFEGSATSVSAAFADTALHVGSIDEDPIPGSQRPPGDVVFLIDESGSMLPIQQGIEQNVSLIGGLLGASIDPQFGLVGFGDGAPTNGNPHAQRPLTDNLSQLDAALAELSTSGGFEPGYDAMALAVSDLMGFRPQAGVCVVLFADEPPQSLNVSQAGALAALQARNATLFTVVNPTLAQGYIDVALATGGATFDIRTFAANPQPLLTAILDRCAEEVIEDTDAPPAAVADTASTSQGSGPRSIDVLANDTDTDGGPKRVESVTQPSHGTVVIGTSGANVTYEPSGAYCNDGSPTDDFTYALNGGSSATVSVTVTCAAKEPVAPVLTVTPAGVATQYSDPLDASSSTPGTQPISIAVTDADTPGGQLAISIRGTAGCAAPASLPDDLELVVAAGTGAGTTADAGSRTATISGVADVSPGVYARCIHVSDGALSDSENLSLTVTPEDARATYTGDMLAFTPPGGGSASVLLRATIQDSNALGAADPEYDGHAGDIRNARVAFVVDGTARCSDVPVALVGADARTGTAQCSVSLSEDAHVVQVQVTHFYRGGLLEPAVVEVARPDGSFVTGGGFTVVSSAAGSYAADDSSRLNYGFNVKHKNQKNLQGHVNIVFRRTVGGVLRTLQVKSNAIDSLGVRLRTPAGTTCSGAPSPSCYAVAEFRSKSNLTDVTDPASPTSLGGNLTLHMTLTDRGEPGSADTIGVTLWRGNTLLFSSNWNGAKTVEQLIRGGNLVVH